MGLVDSLSAYSPRWSPSRCGGSAGYASSRFLPPMAAVFRPRMSEIELHSSSSLHFSMMRWSNVQPISRTNGASFLVAGAGVVEVPHAAVILRYR